MRAYQARDIVREKFGMAHNSIAVIEEARKGDDKTVMFSNEGVRVILQMLQLEIIESLYKLEENEVNEVVKEVVG